MSRKGPSAEVEKIMKKHLELEYDFYYFVKDRFHRLKAELQSPSNLQSGHLSKANTSEKTNTSEGQISKVDTSQRQTLLKRNQLSKATPL